jgi:hypothetical protein
LGLIHLRRPSVARLRDFVAEQSAAELSCRQAGPTLDADLPPGYVHDRESADLGPFDPRHSQRAAEAGARDPGGAAQW